MRLVSVIGGAECSHEHAIFAETIGRLLAASGYAVVCGGRGGVMEAVCRGAWSAGGITIGILPSPDSEGANPYLSVKLPTGIGEARNVLVVLAGEAVVAIGGSFGTLSEIAYAQRMGKPVIGYQTWAAENPQTGEIKLNRVQSPEEALKMLDKLLDSSASFESEV